MNLPLSIFATISKTVIPTKLTINQFLKDKAEIHKENNISMQLILKKVNIFKNQKLLSILNNIINLRYN